MNGSNGHNGNGKLNKDGTISRQGQGGGRPGKWTVEVIDTLADKLLDWIKQPDHYWLGEFASENGAWRQRLDEWADKSPKFAEALKIAKGIQEFRLVSLGLSKNNNPAMAIFALKNVAGWRDQVDVQHGGNINIVTAIPRPSEIPVCEN